VAHILRRCEQGLAQLHRRVALVLQQVERDPLRRPRPDTRQPLERIDETIECGAQFHDE
jgi:hypothetical protein